MDAHQTQGCIVQQMDARMGFAGLKTVKKAHCHGVLFCFFFFGGECFGILTVPWVGLLPSAGEKRTLFDGFLDDFPSAEGIYNRALVSLNVSWISKEICRKKSIWVVKSSSFLSFRWTFFLLREMPRQGMRRGPFEKNMRKYITSLPHGVLRFFLML